MNSTHSNVAYDFEYFEKKPRKSQPTLNVIKNQKYDKRDRMLAVRIISSVAVVVCVVCVMLYSRAQLTELTNQVGKYNTEYQDLVSDSTRLKAEIESKVSLRGVEESAKELGLAKVQPYQVKYVDMEEESGIVTRAGTDKTPIFGQKISLYIHSFLEYINIG